MNRMVIYAMLAFGVYWFVIREPPKPALPPPPPPSPTTANGGGQAAPTDLFSKIAGIVGSFFGGFTSASNSTQHN